MLFYKLNFALWSCYFAKPILPFQDFPGGNLPDEVFLTHRHAHMYICTRVCNETPLTHFVTTMQSLEGQCKEERQWECLTLSPVLSLHLLFLMCTFCCNPVRGKMVEEKAGVEKAGELWQHNPVRQLVQGECVTPHCTSVHAPVGMCEDAGMHMRSP